MSRSRLLDDNEDEDPDFSLFLNTQIQSNLDMAQKEDIQEKKMENVKSDLSKYSFEQPTILNSLREDDEPVIKRTYKTYKPAKQQRRSKQKNSNKSNTLNSITATMANKHSKEKKEAESVLKIVSGKRVRVNEILEKIDKLQSTSSSEPDVSDVKLVYSRAEWINLMKLIRVNYPDLSKKRKISLAKITKVYEEQYDSQMQPSISSNEAGSLWEMAKGVPSVKYSKEDLKWLYDKDSDDEREEDEELIKNLSFLDDQPVINNFTLSQLDHDGSNKENDIETDKKDNFIDLTQKSNSPELKNTFNPQNVEPVSVGSSSELMSAPVSPVKQNRLPKTPTIQRIIQVPSSSPRDSPIVFTSKSLEGYKGSNIVFSTESNDSRIDVRNTGSINEAHLDVKNTVSVNEKLSNLRSTKSGDEIITKITAISVDDLLSVKSDQNNDSDDDDNNELSSPIRAFIQATSDDETDIYSSNEEDKKEKKEDEDVDDVINIINGELEINGVFESKKEINKISTQEFNKLIGTGSPAAFNTRSGYSRGNEINQIKDFNLAGLQTPFGVSSTPSQFLNGFTDAASHFTNSINVRSNSSVYSTAKSQINDSPKKTFKTTIYEYKGKLDNVHNLSTKKAETKVKYTKRKRPKNVIPDSDSEDDEDNITIIEITKEVKMGPHNIEPSGHGSPNTSKLQVPSSPLKYSQGEVPVSDLQNILENSNEKLPPSTPSESKDSDQYTTAIKSFSLVTLKLLFDKWELKGTRTKQDMVKTLLSIYEIMIEFDGIFKVDISDYPMRDKELKQQAFNEFYDKLSEFSPDIVTSSLFNSISSIITKDEELYGKILTYEPISLLDVKELVNQNGFHIDEESIKIWACKTGVCHSLNLSSKDDESNSPKKKPRQKPTKRRKVDKSVL